MLSSSLQDEIYERLYYLNYLANNNYLINFKNFRKTPKDFFAEDTTHIFIVNRAIRILCKLDTDMNYSHPVIILQGIFRHD